MQPALSASRLRSRPSNDREVRGRESEAGARGGELRRRLGPGAVGIVEQRAGRLVVEDAVARIMGGGADKEGVSRQQPNCPGLSEDGMAERDAVVGNGEIHDGVHVRRGKGRAEREPVEPGAARQHVVRRPAVQHVVARVAVQSVGNDIAGQPVVKRRADQSFDGDMHVARRLAGVVLRRAERDRDRRGGAVVGGVVEACAAIEPVAAGPTHKGVVRSLAIELVAAGIAAQPVGPGIARQDVREARARQVFDIDIAVARIAGISGWREQRGDHSRCCVVIGGSVPAGLAVEQVATRTAD